MPAPPPESEPAMVRRRGTLTGLVAAAAAAAAPGGRGAPGDDADDQEHGHAERLRQGEGAEETVVLGAQDLDREALDGDVRVSRHSLGRGGSDQEPAVRTLA